MRQIFLLTFSLLTLLPSAAQAQASRAATASSYIERGNVWFAKGELDQAIDDFSLAISSDPEHAGARYNRAAVRYLKGDLDGALADYNRALELNPTQANTGFNRAGIWREKKSYERALADYNRALELNPSFAAAFAFRGLVYLQQGRIHEA